jgi:RNA polymerase sigma-70 factor (ECF subfamily)
LRQQANIKEFEQFFQEYYIPVLHYCGTIVKDMDDANDIVQQVFVSMWQKSEEINIHTSARAYLYKMVYNASLDFLKHEKIKLRHRKEAPEINNVTAFSDKAAENELEEKIELAIAELPERCGKIFRMSRLKNLKYREIATVLNISEKTVENQMGKALKILREALKDYLPILLLLFIY